MFTYVYSCVLVYVYAVTTIKKRQTINLRKIEGCPSEGAEGGKRN